MALKLTDSGVMMSRGRGKNAVKLELSFKRLESWARTNKIAAAKLMQRSFGRAAYGLKRQLISVMAKGGGVNGVPAFKAYEPFTAALRTIRGLNPNGPIGGYYARKENIVAYRRNGWQIIGWPDKAADGAIAFQDGRGGSSAESMLVDSRSRSRLHRAGISNIPRAYAHNARSVIEPYFHGHAKNNLQSWANAAYYKSLAKLMMETAR